MAGWEVEALATKLLTNRAHVFLQGKLWLLLAQINGVLWLLGAKQDGAPGDNWREATKNIRRLAREWKSPYILTSSPDPRVWELIQRLGGKPIEMTLRMEA